jgi:hypothetical protein
VPAHHDNCCIKWLGTFSSRICSASSRGRRQTSWLSTQFIKLGAASALPGLSRHFVVWDADMIPLRPLRLLHTPRRRLGQGAPVQVQSSCLPSSKWADQRRAGVLHVLTRSAAAYDMAAGHVQQHSAACLDGSMVRGSSTGCWRLQTVVNVGGASAPGYATTYRKLFGEPLAQAPDGSSFVTHWMVGSAETSLTCCRCR